MFCIDTQTFSLKHALPMASTDRGCCSVEEAAFIAAVKKMWEHVRHSTDIMVIFSGDHRDLKQQQLALCE